MFIWESLIGIVVIGGIAFAIGYFIALKNRNPEAAIPYLFVTFASMVTTAVLAVGKFAIIIAVFVWQAILHLKDDDKSDD